MLPGESGGMITVMAYPDPCEGAKETSLVADWRHQWD